ncbi:MAG: DUF1573 domain-containing protein [Candidatus Pacebacteria bacterium]|nr:DUF1573 domain-containing protein [Candidatus Paceibacterota bacterium]
MNKTIIITLLIISGIAGLIWWGSKTQNSVESTTVKSGEKSSLVALETVYDFGKISMKDGIVSKDFTITNNTDKDIIIPRLVTSCMCTKALIVREDGTTNGPFGMEGMGHVPPANETIVAGKSIIIRAAYDPNAHGPAGVGVIDRFIVLTDQSGSDLQLEIKAVVTP